MSMRYTSGSAGRFSFDHASRMAGAVDLAETDVRGDIRKRQNDSPTRLVELQEEMNWTISGLKVWAWRELGITTPPTRQVMPLIPDGSSSANFGGSAYGHALLLSGDAATGDRVTLVPLLSRAGEPWFGFVGAPRIQVSMLEIISSFSNPNDDLSARWVYQVVPVYMNQIGSLIPNPFAPSGIAYNGYEFTRQEKKYWGHGQRLSWPSTPGSRLEVEGPVIGIVHGILVMPAQGTQQAVWNFDAPVPLRPVCQVPAGLIQGAVVDVMQRGMA